MIRILLAATLLCAASTAAGITLPSEKAGLAEPQPEATVQLKALDRLTLRLADDKGVESGRPLHYGKPVPLTTRVSPTTGGQWHRDGSGLAVWRVQVHAPNASSIDLGFSDYWLPNGAELYIYDAAKRLIHGPYTDRHNKKHGQFWSVSYTHLRAHET